MLGHCGECKIRTFWLKKEFLWARASMPHCLPAHPSNHHRSSTNSRRCPLAHPLISGPRPLAHPLARPLISGARPLIFLNESLLNSHSGHLAGTSRAPRGHKPEISGHLNGHLSGHRVRRPGSSAGFVGRVRPPGSSAGFIRRVRPPGSIPQWVPGVHLSGHLPGTYRASIGTSVGT